MSVQRARDVPDPCPTTLSPADAASNAIAYVMENRFRNVPLVDDDGRHMGVFGVSCVSRLVLPQAALMERGLTSLSVVPDDLRDLSRHPKEIEKVPVTVCLNEEAQVVEPDTHLLETLLVLYLNRRSLPDVDPASRRVARVVSYRDLGSAVLAEEV